MVGAVLRESADGLELVTHPPHILEPQTLPTPSLLLDEEWEASTDVARPRAEKVPGEGDNVPPF